MDVALRNVNTMICAHRDNCQVWCRQQGIHFTLAAQLGHVIMVTSGMEFTRNVTMVLPRPTDTSFDWRDLLEWKYFGLNLLQLAIVFDKVDAFSYLCQISHFMREDNYREACGRLVNHPLHLAICVSELPCTTLTEIIRLVPEALLRQTGTVDLTTSRLTPPRENRSTGATSDGNRNLTARTINDNALLAMVAKVTQTFKRTPFLTAVTKTLLPVARPVDLVETRNLFIPLFLKTLTDMARASTVEAMWEIGSTWHSAGVDGFLLWRFWTEVSKTLMTPHWDDSCLFFCLLTWSMRISYKTETFLDFMCAAFNQIIIANKDAGRAATWLPVPVLKLMMKRFEKWDKKREYGGQYRTAFDSIQEMQRTRTLQEWSMLAILEAVKGDTRKVRNIQELPEALRGVFPVPFEARYNQLSKQNINTPEGN